MTPTAVVLYGPPASGKDTITAALTQIDRRYEPFRRLKIGSGKTNGYRLGTPEELALLRSKDMVLYENERYGNTYVVDEPHLADLLQAGRVPVVHLGQVAGVRAVTRYPARWIRVLLWCARETSERRAKARGSLDVAARLAAWDETLRDRQEANASDFIGTIDTDIMQPAQAAATIHSWVVNGHPPPQPSQEHSAK
jgi:guanylate kinase